MKYIRTKDGIYDEEIYNADYILDYELGKIIKKSENLEDLCDEVVYIIDDFFKSAKERKTTRYGIIYTEKGKNIVAKTNENGELELL